jgi:nitrite reductase (NO-forming)
MPFFSAAIATTQPAASWLRWSSLAAVTLGAIGVSLGYATGERTFAATAGLLFLMGVVLTAVATLLPVSRALGPRGGVVTIGYAAALTSVGLGAALATAMLLDLGDIAWSWAWLKPAHAWLNLVGFVSLVIATTLLHFFPTVIGARIQRTRSAYGTVLGLALGAGLVALGFATRSDPVARLGAVLSLAGTASLALYAGTVWRTRARWTGDSGWHAFAMGGLVSAMAWFGLSMALAAGRVLVSGTDPANAATDVLVAPFVAGWMGLALLASATHLVPSVGPGGPHAHAAQRVLLGRGGAARLVIGDLGIALLVVGYPTGFDALSQLGTALLAATLLSTTVLVAIAVVRGAADARRSGTLRA